MSSTIWKRIAVPNDLADQGWLWRKLEAPKPFALENPRLEMITDQFTDPQEAIASARDLLLDADERAALVAEGAAAGARGLAIVPVLPVHLIDQGWRLVTDRTPGNPTPYEVVNNDYGVRTGGHAAPGLAITAAARLEVDWQVALEAQEAAQEAAQELTAAEAPALDFGEASPAPAPLPAFEIGVLENGGDALVDLTLALIREDDDTQHRAAFDDRVVQEYAEAMFSGAEFPAVDVFWESAPGQAASFWLVDGFYRCKAARLIKRETILATIHRGNKREARLFSFGVNAAHGQPRTREDKRRAVLSMLTDREWVTWSDNAIAAHARVSQPFVSKLRHQLNALPFQAPEGGRSGGALNHQTTADLVASPAPVQIPFTEPELPGAATTEANRAAIALIYDLKCQTAKKDPAAWTYLTRVYVRLGERAAEIADTGEGITGQGITNKGSTPAPAEGRQCSQCAAAIVDRETSDGFESGYQDQAGRCWACSPNGGAEQKRKPEPAAALTFAEINRRAPVAIDLYWPARCKLVSIAVRVGGPFALRRQIPIGALELPAHLVALVQEQATIAARKAKPKTRKKKAKNTGQKSAKNHIVKPRLERGARRAPRPERK